MARFVDVNPMPRHPVFTPRQAVAKARSEVRGPDKDYTGLCLHFCAWVYGFESSGVRSAADFWRGTPRGQKRPGDARPPVGALACWTGGAKGFGHISVVVGYRGDEPMIASNDIRRVGRIDVVPLSEVSRRWGQRYVGWTKPYFPFGPADDRRPPRVYKSGDAWGTVYVAQLREGTKKSASIRKLQRRLGLKPTGNWNSATGQAVKRWQRRNGWPAGEGRGLSNRQANKLFGPNYFVKPKPRG